MGASVWEGGSSINTDQSYKTQRFDSVTQGQVSFTITNFAYVPGTESLRVFVNGVRQDIGDDFLEIDSTTFEILGGVDLNDIVSVEALVGSEAAQNAQASADEAARILLEVQALDPANLPLAVSQGGTGNITSIAAIDALDTKGANIASVASINLDNATGKYVHITGTTGPITSFTLGAGKERQLAFDAAVTLNHHAVNLILPGGVNYTTKAGDVLTVRAEAANQVRVISIHKNETTVKGLVHLATVTPTAAAVIDFLNIFTSEFDNYVIVIQGLSAPSGTDQLCLRLANGGVVDSTAGNYATMYASADAVATPTTETYMPLSTTSGVINPGNGFTGQVTIYNANDAAKYKMLVGESVYQYSANAVKGATPRCLYSKAAAISGFRLFWLTAANFAAGGKIRVYGIPNG